MEAFCMKYGGTNQTKNCMKKPRIVTGTENRRVSVQQKVTAHMEKIRALKITNSGEYCTIKTSNQSKLCRKKRKLCKVFSKLSNNHLKF